MQLVAQMDAEGFGACSNHGECMAACPKEISIDFMRGESGLHQGCLFYSFTAAIVSFTASADFCNAACSSGDSFTSMICSNPFRPSLHGTPQ